MTAMVTRTHLNITLYIDQPSFLICEIICVVGGVQNTHTLAGKVHSFEMCCTQ